MSDSVLFATPEMNAVFGKVWGSDARQNVEVSDGFRYAEAVKDFLQKMDAAHEETKQSRLVFG